MSDSPVRHRNYRIMRVSSLGDPKAAEVLYRNESSLRCCSFAEQRRSWLAEKIEHGDALSRAMKSMGHEAEEIICDMENLQRTWAWERGIEVDEKDWRTQLVLHQIAAFVGSTAAAIDVQIVCNRDPVTSAGLFRYITTLLK